jgi:hypothetical protein
MPLKCYQASSTASRLTTAMGFFIAFLMSGILLFTVVNGHSTNVEHEPAPLPALTATTEARFTQRGEVASRLRTILQVREDAYRFRNAEMLRDIYSDDCPCLASDEEAINELLRNGHRWTGIRTSIQVRSAKRVDKRIWVVVAMFRSNVLRIETKTGELVRIEPAGSDLFQFTLVRPQDSQQWVLGLVTAMETTK